MPDVKSLWYDVVSLTFDDGTSAIYPLLPMRSDRIFKLRTNLIPQFSTDFDETWYEASLGAGAGAEQDHVPMHSVEPCSSR